MRRTTLTALPAWLAVLGAAAVALGQPPAGTGVTSVRDGAKVFATAPVEEANRVLRAVENESHWQTRIETVASLGGKPAPEYAADAAKKSGVQGLYVLIAPAEKKIQLEPSDSARSRFSPAVQKLIVATFLDATKHAEQRIKDLAADSEEARKIRRDGFDEGLGHLVALVRRVALGYGVLDHAKLFDTIHTGLVDHALNTIRTRRQVVIETVDSLGGKPVKDVAAANARALQVRGVYVLIAKNDRKVFIEPSDSARKDFPPSRTKAIVDAVVNAFKATDDPDRYNKGLQEAVVLIGNDLGITPAALSAAAFVETIDDAPGDDLRALARADVAAERKKAESREPAEAHAQPLVPAAQPTPPPSGPAPRPVPPGAAAEPDRPAAGGGSVAPLLLGGLAVVVVLWLLGRVLRRPATPAQPPRPDARSGYGQAGPGPGPGATAPAEFGYGQPGPGPRPGYGPGPPPAPGYGYGPPPPAAGGGGGGFVSSALGGIGGAIVGNMIYDKFGRPQPAPTGTEPPHHAHGAGAFPPDGGAWPQPDATADAASAPAPTPTPETYDPNAGAGGDWGTPDPTPSPDQDAPAESVGGDWSTDDPVEEAAGSDWSAPDPAEEPTGDWSGPEAAAEEPTDDWSGDSGEDDGSAASGGDDDQGGSW